MIKLSYNQVPIEYIDFVDKFKGKLKKWLNNGYIGNPATKVNLCDDCRVIFRYLLIGDNLKKYLFWEASDFSDLILFVEQKYPQLAADRVLSPHDKRTPRSDLYNCLYKAFVNLGYDDTDFPNYQLTENLKLKTCPYCNAEEIIYQTIQINGQDHHIMDSELDHFYPKSRIPYLALCIHNLVPSAKMCNGANGKHDNDTYAQKLINPFALNDSNGFMFELDCFYQGVLDFNTFIPNCKIYTLTPDPSLSSNNKTFKISERYECELEKAKKVWMLNRKVMSRGFSNLIKEKEQEVGVILTYEEWLDVELDIDCVEYKKKLSKFCMDIWGQLQRTRI